MAIGPQATTTVTKTGFSVNVPVTISLSEGRYEARVHNGYPPAHYPETRPHYE